METNELKPPRELAYDQKYEKDYNSLTGRDEKEIEEKYINSPFFGRTNRDIFLYAMALGFFHKKRIKLESPRNNISWNALKDEGEWLVYSVAIAEKNDLSVLLNMKEVAEIAEEYANGGLQYLLDEFMKPSLLADPDRRMESDIRRLWNILTTSDKSTVGYVIGNPDNESSAQILERLEQALRNLIISKLSLTSQNWLKDRIPFDPNNNIIERWERNRQRNIRGYNLFRKGEEVHLIDYSELSDLYQIIKWTKNWKECFESIFLDRKIFESDMEQLLMIRPDIAHNRPLTSIQINKLKAIASHMIELIEKS